MRWFCGALLLVLFFDTRAGEVFLIPESHPKPIYPLALSRAGVIGKVSVRFMVSADGLVSKVTILESDHPDLAEASRVAIEQWRFKPWIVEGDRPAEQEIIAPMVFNIEAPDGVYQWLKDLKCREVNQRLMKTLDHYWLDAPAFHYTRAYLSSGFLQRQMTNEQRLALIAKLNRRAPTIGRQCLGNPSARFMRFLPEDIRKLF